MKPRLRLLARGTALVADPHALDKGVRRFIGRRWQEVLPGRWSWVPTGEPQECAYHGDLVKALKDGDLWPADEPTAAVAKVAFDPAFGGEVTETIKAFKKKTAAGGAPAAPEEPKKAAEKPAGKGDG